MNRWYIRNKVTQRHILEYVFLTEQEAIEALEKLEDKENFEVFSITWEQGQ